MKFRVGAVKIAGSRACESRGFSEKDVDGVPLIDMAIL